MWRPSWVFESKMLYVFICPLKKAWPQNCDNHFFRNKMFSPKSPLIPVADSVLQKLKVKPDFVLLFISCRGRAMEGHGHVLGPLGGLMSCLNVSLQASSEDLYLPSCHDEELVDNLCCEDSEDGSSGSDLSLTKALQPLVDFPPHPDVPWGSSTRYKTELCTSYSASGSCSYAERCQFAHGLHELHVPFRHPKYKTALCRGYHTSGYCYYGNRCLFVHSPSEQRQVRHRRRNVPCRTFSSLGVCPFGTRCNFLHLEDDVPAEGEKAVCPQVHTQPREWKPRGALCHTFSSFGFCLYGTRCRFQHGLPNKTRSSDLSSGCTSSNNSTCSSPLSASPGTTPSPDTVVHNAFSFSSQHLSDLLLPLVLHLQQLEGSKSQEVWDSRAPWGCSEQSTPALLFKMFIFSIEGIYQFIAF